MTAVVYVPHTLTETEIADDAHVLHRQIVAMREELDAKTVTFGRMLCAMRDRQLYLALGYDTFYAYLASDEVGVERRMAERYIRWATRMAPLPSPEADPADLSLVQETVITRAMPVTEAIQIGVSKAQVIIPMLDIAETPEEAREWIDKARTNSRGDLEKEVARAQGREKRPLHAELEHHSYRLAALANKLPYVDDPRGHLEAMKVAIDTVLATL